MNLLLLLNWAQFLRNETHGNFKALLASFQNTAKLWTFLQRNLNSENMVWPGVASHPAPTLWDYSVTVTTGLLLTQLCFSEGYLRQTHSSGRDCCCPICSPILSTSRRRKPGWFSKTLFGTLSYNSALQGSKKWEERRSSTPQTSQTFLLAPPQQIPY